jgi:hypothetical protein
MCFVLFVMQMTDDDTTAAASRYTSADNDDETTVAVTITKAPIQPIYSASSLSLCDQYRTIASQIIGWYNHPFQCPYRPNITSPLIIELVVPQLPSSLIDIITSYTSNQRHGGMWLLQYYQPPSRWASLSSSLDRDIVMVYNNDDELRVGLFDRYDQLKSDCHFTWVQMYISHSLYCSSLLIPLI